MARLQTPHRKRARGATDLLCLSAKPPSSELNPTAVRRACCRAPDAMEWHQNSQKAPGHYACSREPSGFGLRCCWQRCKSGTLRTVRNAPCVPIPLPPHLRMCNKGHLCDSPWFELQAYARCPMTERILYIAFYYGTKFQ